MDYGEPVKLEPDDGGSGGANQGQEPEGRNDGVLKGCGLGCGGLILAFVLLVVAFSCAGSGEPEERAPTSAEARFVCEEWVKEQLKAPATAEFTDGAVTGDLASGYTITGSVDAQNSFGALVRTDWICEVRYDEPTEYWRGSAVLLD